MNDKLIAINREILELKTAQVRPSTFQTYHATGQVTAGYYSGFYFWRIHYKDVGDTSAPITYTQYFSDAFRLYDAVNNTQDLEAWYDDGNISAGTFDVWSSRPIDSVEQITAPGPSQQWYQVRQFYPADMGTAVGYCLQNCRLGFHIYSGTYASAKADADAQQANGTLHADLYPPSYLAVPVYIDNGNWDGHVGVWDHGTFYSDGYIINDYVSYYGAANIRGWGEFCDGARVVEHV